MSQQQKDQQTKHCAALAQIGLQPVENVLEMRKFYIVNDENKYFAEDGTFSSVNNPAVFSVKITPKYATLHALFLRAKQSSSSSFLEKELCLDYWDAKDPRLSLHRCSSPPGENQRWLIDAKEMTILPNRANQNLFSQRYGAVRLVPVPYAVMSYNLGYYVVLNRVAGSEASFVRECKKSTSHGGNGASAVPGVSQCTKNAIDATVALNDAHRFAFIGLQEFPVAESRETLHYFNTVLPEFDVYTARDVSLAADRTQVGGGVQLTSPNASMLNAAGRSLVAVWFPLVSTVGVSLHMDHYDDVAENVLEQRINAFFATLEPLLTVPVRTVIVSGDFNRDLSRVRLRAFGHELRVVRAVKPHRSCCFDSAFAYQSDLIFTSEFHASENAYFGLSREKAATKTLQSDHFPVVFHRI